MRILFGVTAVLSWMILTSGPIESCSRVLWNDNGQCVLVGRNMDWFEDMKSNMWLLPRGMERSGLSPSHPLRWTSKYGSLAITAYEAGTVDGLNEKGLAMHCLYLPETSVSPRDNDIAGMTISLWGQYYLDQFATVQEVVDDVKKESFQLLMAVEPGSQKAMTVHLALNDSSGDSAILECLNGKIHVYHDRSYTVMTNQPTFDQQLEILKQYRGFGGDKRLPGTHEPSDRFVRGAYYVNHLPKPNSEREAVAALMSVMRNVSAPFGISDPERPNVSTTIWRTITDLTHHVVYYDSVFSPQIFWVDLKKVNFDSDQPVRKLTIVDNFELSQEVFDQFEPVEMFEFLGPVD